MTSSTQMLLQYTICSPCYGTKKQYRLEPNPYGEFKEKQIFTKFRLYNATCLLTFSLMHTFKFRFMRYKSLHNLLYFTM